MNESFISEFNLKKAEVTTYAEQFDNSEIRLRFAHSFCGSALEAFWSESCNKFNCSWKIIDPFIQINQPPQHLKCDAQALGSILSNIPFSESSYLIGTLYTALLPTDIRANYGAYYTPPALVDRLIGIVTNEGFDWKRGKIVDLSCGGGAFLSPVALQILESLPKKILKDPQKTIETIADRLTGVEIDPFSAWTSQVLIEIALFELCIAAETRCPAIVNTHDALTLIPENKDKADLVIGNPPYGKVALSPELRKMYLRSLFGHANLYGIFTDLAIRWTKSNGYIAYVTPTSFLGGQYFKSLRSLLAQKAQPIVMDFISERRGVFEDVLQDTMLVVYKRERNRNTIDDELRVQIHTLKSNGENKPVISENIGYFSLPIGAEDPWLIPKAPNQVPLIEKLLKMPSRLKDYGFEIVTGQLVWNRHRNQIYSDYIDGSYPLIWAESITNNGQFDFKSRRKNRLPYFLPLKNQDYMITDKSCILVKRTTAKEQKKRIYAAILPQDFISEYGGVIVENHINIIRYTTKEPLISLEALTIFLNSRMLDRIYRLISGSVAVSAFELNEIPFPEQSEIKQIETLMLNGSSDEEIDQYIKKIYKKNG